MLQQAVNELFDQQDVIKASPCTVHLSRWLINTIKICIELKFVDIHGAAKTKSVPISGLKAIEGEGVGFAGFTISGMGMQPHGQTLWLKSSLSDLIPVPWQPGYGRVVCEGYVNGKPHPYDSRYILCRQSA